MCADRAVRLSQGTAPMGRKRTVNHDLPPRMSRKGASYYYVSNAPRRWIPLGSDLARAKRKWAELETGSEGLSVAELVQQYIDRGNRPESTRLQYGSYLRMIEEAFPVRASALRSQHVALWRELPAQRARPRQTLGAIAILRGAFRLGHEQGLCDVLTVGVPEVHGRDRYLTDDEFRAIRAQAPRWLQVAMDLAYLTAARPVDVREMRWEQVGEALGMRQVKTKQRMAFAMSPELASVLDEARSRPILGLFVIASDKGQPISQDTLGYAWRKARKAAAVQDAQFRDIRSKGATDAEAGGQDYQKLLGHTSRAMSDRYLKNRRTVMAEPVRRKL
jgi:integrase